MNKEIKTLPIYSIVIPCYNSAPWLPELIERIIKVMSPRDVEYEVLLVNDCTPNPDTWHVITELSQRYRWVKGVDLQFNVGQFKALLAGLELAKGRFIITMDDDLQHPPEEIPKLIDEMDSHLDMDAIIGAYKTKQHNAMRNGGRLLVNKISERLYGKPKDFNSTAFRIMKRSLVESLLEHKTMKPIMGALILKNTRRLKNVEVEHHPRTQGKSGYSITQLIGSTFDNVIDSSTAPLRFFGGTGIVISAFSALIAIFYVFRWSLGYSTSPGFTTLVLLTTFFGGMILFGIGLVGEYLSRVVIEVSRSPRYVIRETVGEDENEDLHEWKKTLERTGT